MNRLPMPALIYSGKKATNCTKIINPNIIFLRSLYRKIKILDDEKCLNA